MFNQTPLHKASENGHLSVVEFLVSQNADINNHAIGLNNGTPLHRAAMNGHLFVVEYLVNQKAEIDSKDNNAEFYCSMRLLFIMLQDLVIFVLFNISLIKKPISNQKILIEEHHWE